jgi:hypothetical protein
MVEEQHSFKDYPVCPDSGEHMLEVTNQFDGIPVDLEIWESPESGSLFIRTYKPGKSKISDYTPEDLANVRYIAKHLLK